MCQQLSGGEVTPKYLLNRNPHLEKLNFVGFILFPLASSFLRFNFA